MIWFRYFASKTNPSFQENIKRKLAFNALFSLFHYSDDAGFGDHVPHKVYHYSLFIPSEFVNLYLI